jgi:hypothetical protein
VAIGIRQASRATSNSADPAAWKKLAVTRGRVGYLYVIQFDCDVIKVGKTVDPNGRMTQHISEAFAFRASPVKVWFSTPHAGYDASESTLIAYVTRDGDSRKVRREYFHGADFDRAVELAQHAIAGTNPFQGDRPAADAADVEALITLAAQKVEQAGQVARLAASAGDVRAALAMADILRETVAEEAFNAKFYVIVDEFNCQGRNFTRLAERLNVSRQRAKQIIGQAAARGIHAEQLSHT